MAPRKNTSRKTAAKPATKATAKKTATKPAAKPAKPAKPVDENKAAVESAISLVVDKLGLDNQKSRYKAQRAIAYQAFVEALEAGEFADLVERAIDNADELPTGWTVGGRAAAPAKPAAVEEEPEEEDEEIVEDESEVEEDTDPEDEDDDEGQAELDLEEEDEVEEAPEPAKKTAAKKPARRRRVARK